MGKPEMWSSLAGILTKSLNKQNQNGLTKPEEAVLVLFGSHELRLLHSWSCPSSDRDHSESHTEKLVTEKSAEYSPPFIPRTWCSIDYSSMLNKVHSL